MTDISDETLDEVERAISLVVESCGEIAPASAWLLAILDALIAKETDDAD